MRSSRSVLRRTFLKGVCGAAATVAVPLVIPSSALGLAGLVAPSKRVTMGMIGCGGHGVGWNLPQIFRNPDDPEADKLLSRKQREPWTIGNIESWIEKNA